MDIYTKKKRSEIMSHIRGSRNKDTELLLIRLFREIGITGWRRNKNIIGKPDFVFPKQRLVVFVDGCFWHSCPKHGILPATNRLFWKRKLHNNKNRDRTVTKLLQLNKWRVIRIWECELQKNNKKIKEINKYTKNAIIQST